MTSSAAMAVANAQPQVSLPLDLEMENWNHPRLWAGSIAMIIALHGGALAGALLWDSQDPPSAPPPGAMMIEMAPLPAAPPAPPVAKPPDIPQEATRPPEKMVEPEKPKPPPVKKAEVPLPKPKVAPAPPKIEAPVAEKVAEKDTAPPAAEAPLDKSIKAPAAGTYSSAASTAIPNWQGTLRAHLENHKRYPAAARFRRQEGVATVRFVMDRNGKVLSAKLERSSGKSLLDEEALALLDRAQPLPPPPPEVVGETLELVVPVQFFLR